MTDREIFEEALKALESAERHGAGDWGRLKDALRDRLAQPEPTVKQSLTVEQPEQEPVAWWIKDPDYESAYVSERRQDADEAAESGMQVRPLFFGDIAPQPVQEPAYRCRPYSSVPGEAVSPPVDYYTSPQTAQQQEPVGHGGRPMTLRECMEAEEPASKQEPVAWVERDGELVWNNREAAIGRNLYTSPPASKPLTKERVIELEREVERLNAVINTPQSDDFLRAVSTEAEHQRQRWGSEHDAGKSPADWFWLIGYLAGKALHSHAGGNVQKAEHHVITTAAACANWHRAMFGKTDMRPGIDAEAAHGITGDRQ